MARRRPAVALAALAALAMAGASLSAAPHALPAQVSGLSHASARISYPVFDSQGRPTRKQSWYVTDAGGNCCEVQVAATPSGRLLEFGGSTLNYSDDRGRTWTRVGTLDPRVNGEGAVVAAPGGDVVGIGWDPYSGDRLHAFKYDAKTQAWSYAESPVHTPFFDRPWIAVAEGPFTWQGRTVPYLSFVISGYTGTVLYVSDDGLTYVPASRTFDAAPADRWMDAQPDPDLDYFQPHVDSNFVPVTGGMLAIDPELLAPDCGASLLGKDGRWTCVRLPNGVALAPRLLMDSRGWLHHLARVPGSSDVPYPKMTYAVSPDGGRSWRSIPLVPPGGGTIEAVYDMKAHGKRQTTAIAVHVQREGRNGAPDTEVDFVFRISTAGKTPKLVETYQLGNGDLESGENILSANGPRFDFSSVAILPDGRIAASFADRAHPTPALAVLT